MKNIIKSKLIKNIGHSILFHKILILSLLFILNPESIHSAEIKMGPVLKKNGDISFSFAISSYQKRDIIEAIRRGIEVKIFYDIEIVKKSTFNFLFKKKVLKTKRIKRSVKYDFWNKTFLIKEGDKSISYHNENSMLKYFFEVNNIMLFKASLVQKERCYLRVKAELTSVKLYFPMNLIFKYIVGFWDFDTGWVNGPSLEIWNRPQNDKKVF